MAWKFYEGYFMLIINAIDRIFLVIFKLFFHYIILFFFSTKNQSILKEKSRKKIFIASGLSYKYPKEKKDNIVFKERWNKGFQSQLLHEGFDFAYTIYIGDKHEIYKLCPRVICIVLKKFHVPYFKRLSNFINEQKMIFCGHYIHKTRDICAVETFFPGDGLVISYYLSKITNLPIIAQCQGDYDLSSYNDSLQEKTFRQIISTITDKLVFHIFLKQTSLVLGYSDHCASFVICNGAHPKKVRRLRIRSFIEDFQKTNNLDSPEPKNCPHKKKIFLWSRFSPEKKLNFALMAVINVLKKHQDTHCYIAGYGPLDNELKSRMHEVQNQVTFLGNLERPLIKTYISNADVNLVPLGGHALIEAGLCKKPVVAFNWEWHTEMITHMESSILVDYPNTEKFEEAILYLIKNPEESTKMGIKLFNRVVSLFDEDLISKREKDIFQEFFEKIEGKAL